MEEIDDDEITGEWARSTSNMVLSEKVNKEISECLQLIKTAVKSNKMELFHFSKIEHLTKISLEKRGFFVKISDDQRDGYTVRISW